MLICCEIIIVEGKRKNQEFDHVFFLFAEKFFDCFQMCLDPALAIQNGEKVPPLYICIDCADIMCRDESEYLVDVLLPMQHVSLSCENKVSPLSPADMGIFGQRVIPFVLLYCSLISQLK